MFAFVQLCFLVLALEHLSIVVHGTGYETSLLDSTNVSLDKRRPPIYTFVHLEGSDATLYDEPILAWAEAWAEAGFHPIVLSELDASAHPGYESYVKKLSLSGSPKEGMACRNI